MKDIKAMTLVELLAGMAIVVILVTLVFAGASRLREVSDSARCISNLKQTGAAVLAHAADNGGRSVAAFVENKPEYDGHPQKGQMWHPFLRDKGYLPNLSVVVCPSFPPKRWDGSKNTMSTYGLRRNVSDKNSPAFIIGRGERASSYVLLADSCKTGELRQNYYLEQETSGSKSDRIHTRHAGRANIFFADGSVRALTPQEIVDLNDGWGLGRSIDTNEYSF